MDSTKCNGGVESRRCVLDKGGFRTIFPTLEDIIRLKSPTFDVGQNNNGRSKVDLYYEKI